MNAKNTQTMYRNSHKGLIRMAHDNSNVTGRTTYFDYLRVFAIFAVIIIHTASQNWHSADVHTFEWQTFNFYDSIVRWGAPIFVMISGAIFLNRDVPLKRIYSKYILRMVLAFITWSLIYTLFMDGSLTSRVEALIKGHYHMWFILMIVGMYMSMPLIKPLTEKEWSTKYYMVLSFIFAFAYPELCSLANDFGSDQIIKGLNAVSVDVKRMNMQVVLGYMSYFVLGFYLNKIDLNKRQRICIYILGILGAVFTITVDLIVALKTQAPCSTYYENFNVNVLLESIAVFTWFKYRKYSNYKLNGFVQKLSKYCFGAYLVHILVLEQLNNILGLNTLSLNSAVAVLSIGALTFVFSFSLSAILNAIPIINRYIV